MADQVRITLRRSPIGGTSRQRQTVRGLGLRRLGQSRVVDRTPSVAGMIEKVRHLLEIEEPAR